MIFYHFPTYPKSVKNNNKADKSQKHKICISPMGGGGGGGGGGSVVNLTSFLDSLYVVSHDLPLLKLLKAIIKEIKTKHTVF